MNNKKLQNIAYDMIIKMKRYVILLLLFVIFFGNSQVANSQISTGGDGDFLIEFAPEIPKANELVGVFVKSYSTNIDTANFTWRVNGKTIKSGVGEKNFTFTMGDNGQRITLDLTIKSAEGAVLQKNYSFLPSSVDLIWQSSGYVPPFYKGKALFAHQNTVSVVAIPHIPNQNGIEMNPKNMIYKWKKNGSVIESASGFGKNVYTLDGSLISRDINISVEVVPQDESSVGYSTITIKPITPSVIFYKKDPLYGINFQKALGVDESFGNSNEISLFASPFFFDLVNSEDYISYKWLINGIGISDSVGTRNQTFRQKEGTGGTSNISLIVENSDKLLQYATKNIGLTFKLNEN